MVDNPRGKFTTDGYRRVMDKIGPGTAKLVGSVVFDQVYAHYQHEGTWFKHPRGGQAKYLETPLLGNHKYYMETLAHELLNGQGIEHGMVKVVDSLAAESSDRAPIEFGYLAGSAHPSVRRGTAIVYNRPPNVRRLTEEELKTIHRNRGAL